ncbi:hypothetical protein DFW101_1668 [Solidesulfovibrio carbinoliphilus subsp. oakridgensis]|uniref:DUF4381 domain-containing protein n=1 Tax=Solidesulfovibrio carbinoliphilus subsp. oakridgensis TaxID=694327 RepID=G7Q7Y2_9BACT|nr:hypothetical protein [Solidesulfovibrio carbinoliphilus]EHJ47676.1 hypothetical protein DFW101_1668 [Solidesulfovibrio carbinoliphilus subsp. oakridgensis]
MDDIRDIKEPVPFGGGNDWPALAGLAGLLAVGGLAVWRWRRQVRIRARPFEAVRAGLGRLEASSAGLDDRTFYFELAGLVREALGLRLGLTVEAMTTAEILPHLSGLPERLRQPVAGLLGRADPARYAGEAVGARDRSADLAAALALAGGRR